MILLVVGAGYVGLVTGTCLAEMGHQVICLDIDERKVEQLKNGIIPIYEPGLEEMVKRNLKAKRLSFTTNYAASVQAALVCFLAVETPETPEGGANLHCIKKAAASIAEHMNGYKVIVNKSTVPVGTAKEVKTIVKEILKKRNAAYDFDVISNPEFLKEGAAVNDFMKPERVIIGADNTEAAAIMKEIYSPFMLTYERLIITDIASAEMIKYAANAMLATRISFMNELSRICEENGADINEVRKGIGSDKRIGINFLYPGVGYGGSCLPKDIKALRAQSRVLGVDTPLLDAVDLVNHTQITHFFTKISTYYQEKGLRDKTFAIWGLAFKPDTDDMRAAPSITIIQELLNQGAKLRLYDPVAMDAARKVLLPHDHLAWCHNEYEAAAQSDGIILLTEWKQFRFLDFAAILKSMKGNAFFDGRNQYNPHQMKVKGFDYLSVGRTPVYSHQDLPEDLIQRYKESEI